MSELERWETRFSAGSITFFGTAPNAFLARPRPPDRPRREGSLDRRRGGAERGSGWRSGASTSPRRTSRRPHRRSHAASPRAGRVADMGAVGPRARASDARGPMTRSSGSSFSSSRRGAHRADGPSGGIAATVRPGGVVPIEGYGAEAARLWHRGAEGAREPLYRDGAARGVRRGSAEVETATYHPEMSERSGTRGDVGPRRPRGQKVPDAHRARTGREGRREREGRPDGSGRGISGKQRRRCPRGPICRPGGFPPPLLAGADRGCRALETVIRNGNV